MDLSTHFSYGPLRKFMEYVATRVMESQELAVDDTNTENIQTTGTGSVLIAGQPLNLPEDAELDISEDTETQDNCTNASGAVIEDGQSQYFIVTAKTDGTLSIWEAGDAAETGSEELKVPAFDPSTYVVLGFIKIDNDTGSDFTMGTTGLDTSNLTVEYTQAIGSVYPHKDNLTDVI